MEEPTRLLRESEHRIHNAFGPEKLATLGQGLRMDRGPRSSISVEAFGGHGWDVVEMVLADKDDRDLYVAAQWLTTRR